MTHRTRTIKTPRQHRVASAAMAMIGLLLGTGCIAAHANAPSPASTKQSWRCTSPTGAGTCAAGT